MSPPRPKKVAKKSSRPVAAKKRSSASRKGNEKPIVLVCGGAGFVGQNLIFELEKKYRVRVVDKHAKNLTLLKRLHPDVEAIHADLAEHDWYDACRGVQCVVQLNAQIASERIEPFRRNNVVATERIIEAMKKHKIRDIVHISSAAVNSIRKDDYAQTKEEGENLVTSSGLRYAVLRPSLIYGPFDNKNVGWLMNFFRRYPAFPVPGHGRYPRQPVYVGDFARIITYLVDHPQKANIYNINGDPINFIDMVKSIRKGMGVVRPVVKLPLPVFKAALVVFNNLRGRAEFTPDQVASLTTGEVFDGIAWWDEFDIPKTSFLQGIKNMTTFKYRKERLERCY